MCHQSAFAFSICLLPSLNRQTKNGHQLLRNLLYFKDYYNYIFKQVFVFCVFFFFLTLLLTITMTKPIKKWLVNNPCRRQIFANKLIWINFFIKKRILLKLNSLEGKRVAFMNNLNGIIIFPEWTKCIAHNINLNIFIIVDKRI